MKRIIRVLIDCGVKTCGKCQLVERDWCWGFLQLVADGKRCDECLKAEAK